VIGVGVDFSEAYHGVIAWLNLENLLSEGNSSLFSEEYKAIVSIVAFPMEPNRNSCSPFDKDTGPSVCHLKSGEPEPLQSTENASLSGLKKNFP